MPWYYAGPEAKPVGPISVEELHRLRVSGSLSADTYIIEYTGQPGATLAWKRYHEVFPTNLSPVPPAVVLAQAVPPVAVLSPGVSSPQAHPLFPSAAPAPTTAPLPPAASPLSAPAPVSAATGAPPVSPYLAATPRHDPYAVRPTNSSCAWGFGLGLVGFFLSFVCGIGLFPALLSVVLCIVGLVQLQRRPDQAGHGLAISGLVLAAIALLISLIFALTISIPIIKAHEETVTEQTPSDSE